MAELGYFLSSEEHPPSDLVANARAAEEAGFCFALLSDHFHPWTSQQGQSPFAWSVLGAIATMTHQLKFGTAVTCPTIRTHPAIIAQAAATVAAMAPGRFWLGVGTGEALNEHITGERWPSPPERFSMLEEAIDIIRALWTGESVTRTDGHFRVDRAQLFTLPERAPMLLVAASGSDAAGLAARNDGLITSHPSRETMDAFEEAGGHDKPRVTMLRVCWDKDEEAARELVRKQWPNGAYTGSMHTDLPTPQDFEEAAKFATDEHLKDVIVGPDTQQYLDAVHQAQSLGYDHIVFHQVGKSQREFMRFFADEIHPQIKSDAQGGVQLDRMVEQSFPASDPLPTWAGSDPVPSSH
jgi:coenzyme F420-dependent glucose-6-phosphate dehydrogenase